MKRCGRKVKTFIFILVITSGGIIASCAVFNHAVEESVLFPSENGTDSSGEDFMIKSGIRVENIEVKKAIGSESVKSSCEYILEFLLAGKNSNARDGIKEERYPADVVLREDSFLKGFDALNTVTLEITIYTKERNRVLKEVFITEESVNTISSNLYLYRILKKGIRKTGL
ncbi:MAG: hypothetical protein H7A26_03860 [Spirochaetales bacterium]|nr:hypothetical protein [Spirochaetales bacterium]